MLSFSWHLAFSNKSSLIYLFAIMIRNQYVPAFSYYAQQLVGNGETSATPTYTRGDK